MKKAIAIYVLISLMVSVVNLFRYIRCCYLKSVYNHNFRNGTPHKNHNLRNSAFSLFDKAHVSTATHPIKAMIHSYYKNLINNAFDYSKGHFRYQLLHAPFWIFHILDNATIFLPLRHISNKFLSVILAFLEGFALYLLGLYLDTTGIGSKILTFLLDSLNVILDFLGSLFR